MYSCISAFAIVFDKRLYDDIFIEFVIAGAGIIAEFAIPSASRMCPGCLSRRWYEN